MRFSAHLSELIKQFREVAKIASGSGKKNDDITLNVLLKIHEKTLTIKATDYSIELEASIPLTDVQEEGVVTVNATKLIDVCSRNSSAENVQFYTDENRGVLIINADNTVYEDDFQSVVLSQKQLKKLIDLSVFCVSNEDFRDYLKGVRFEAEGSTLSVFSSDAHRMAMLETQLAKPIEQPIGALISKNGTEQISSIIDGNSDATVELKFAKNSVSVNCNGYSLKTKLIVVPYPNVRTALPSNFSNEVIVDRARFIELINRVSVLSTKRVKGITFLFSDGKCDFKSENSEHEVATHSEKISFSGAPIEITLNHTFVNDCLSHLSSDEVRIKFDEPLKGVVISPVPKQDPTPTDIQTEYVISRIIV